MAPSKRPEATLALGKRIVQELELDETCETLSKWMAHYLAEQMLAVKSAKSKAQKEAAQSRCCELIMRLWAARVTLPGGARPLGNLDEALRALLAMCSDQAKFPIIVGAAEKMSSPWLTFARDSYVAEKRMAHIAFLTGVLDANFGHEKQWLDEHSELLSGKESCMIKTLDGWLNRDVHWLSQSEQKSVAELPPKERAEIILKELEAVVNEQSKALELLKKQLKTKRKKSLRTT